ncbi:hypothetical protein PF005_g5266 [Phytophthora fragariae]|uniref:Uncharacterized protein n=1 Tax=Phytophthora fragariae TaxID=53985 RepID=A0A6A3LYU5_9STRA|nr:hypothetical protein PF011_g4017 [Phytophthora fragariae]KAE9135546.1 hypothetical protein PF007_g2513 [Phytophthora fragariae]KAE9226098.1 hypothetical protein PF005_g5266 [Phytophthora fragariae]
MPRRSSRRALLSDLRTLYISFRLGNPHADHCFVSRMALRSKDLRQLVRISKRSFCSLHNYIYDNPVFHSTSRNTHHEQQPKSVSRLERALPLSQRPAIDGSSYFDRKKLVCDND